MAKSHRKLVAPTEVNRTVAPVRRQNANFERPITWLCCSKSWCSLAFIPSNHTRPLRSPAAILRYPIHRHRVRAIVKSLGSCEIGPMPACFSEQGGSHRRGGASAPQITGESP
jgi:hypothetical protein